MAVVNRNTSIEFIVKPKQDLYLEGSLRKLPRVTKGINLSCLYNCVLIFLLYFFVVRMFRRGLSMSDAEEPELQLLISSLRET